MKYRAYGDNILVTYKDKSKVSDGGIVLAGVVGTPHDAVEVVVLSVSDYGFESCGIYDGDELIVHKHHLTHIDKNFGDGLELCSVKVNNILGVIG